MAAEMPHHAVIRTTFRSATQAGLALRSLEVDKELKPDKMSHELANDGCDLVLTLRAVNERMLRIGIASQLDLLGAVARTFREFSDDPMFDKATE